MRRIVCYVRRMQAWAKNSQFTSEHIQLWNVDKIALAWDEVFNISYVEFRHMLHNLQKVNFVDMRFDEVVDSYHYKPSDARIVPIDDDDWFHPNLIDTLREVQDSIVFWNMVNYDLGKIWVRDALTDPIQFETNNYAVINQKEEYLHHTYANKSWRNRIGRHIPLTLSAHNRTIASLSLLTNYRSDLKAGLRYLYDVYRAPLEVVNDVPHYFVDLAERTRALYFEKLLLRRQFYKLL